MLTLPGSGPVAHARLRPPVAGGETERRPSILEHGTVIHVPILS